MSEFQDSIFDEEEDFGDSSYSCYRCHQFNFICADGRDDICINCAADEDAEIEANGGIDKCLNCGRYKHGNQLNQYQCCIKGCTNPNEF